MTTVDTTAPDRPIAELARAFVEENTVELPPLPELATRVRAMLADENVDIQQVAQLIGSDAAIASTLLRRANSVMFGGLSEVTDIAHAVTRLGLKEVEALVTTVALKGAFEISAPHRQEQLRALWDHSLMVALAAKRLATRASVEAEAVFLAGLLHDIGRLVVLKSIDDLQTKQNIDVTAAVLEELVEVLHCELGHDALVGWNLPEALCLIAKHHEDATKNDDDFALLAVRAADAISCKLGFHPAPDPDLALLEVPAIELLNLEDVELATLMVDLEEEFDALHALL